MQCGLGAVLQLSFFSQSWSSPSRLLQSQSVLPSPPPSSPARLAPPLKPSNASTARDAEDAMNAAARDEPPTGFALGNAKPSRYGRQVLINSQPQSSRSYAKASPRLPCSNEANRNYRGRRSDSLRRLPACLLACLPACLLVRRSSDQWRQEISQRSSGRRGPRTRVVAKRQARNGGISLTQSPSNPESGSVSASVTKGRHDAPNSSTLKLVQTAAGAANSPFSRSAAAAVAAATAAAMASGAGLSNSRNGSGSARPDSTGDSIVDKVCVREEGVRERKVEAGTRGRETERH
jgi:hypothetical protein